MGQKKRRAATTTRIVTVPSAPRAAAPIIRINTPRPPAPAKKHHGRARRAASAVGGFVSQHNVDAFVGGGVFGYAVKQGWVDKLPAIPIIGRTGTAALVLDYFAKRGGGSLVKKAAIAAAVLSGYQLGHDGKITGDDDVSGAHQTTGDSFSTSGDAADHGE